MRKLYEYFLNASMGEVVVGLIVAAMLLSLLADIIFDRDKK